MPNRPPCLYHIPQTRSATALWMLEETGAAYDTHVFKMKEAEHKSAEFLAINPMGKVPTLTHRGEVVSETGAIVAYLADVFPEIGLAPAIGDAQRGPYLKWLFFYAGCVEPAVTDLSMKREPGPASRIGYGSYEDVVQALRSGLTDSDYLTGASFTAADLLVGGSLRWLIQFELWPKDPIFTAYMERCTDRPAFKAATEKDAAFAKQYGSPFDA